MNLPGSPILKGKIFRLKPLFHAIFLFFYLLILLPGNLRGEEIKRFDSAIFSDRFEVQYWRYNAKITDNSGANPKLDDSHWDSALSHDFESYARFEKPAWYRFHFRCGGDVLHIPLSFTLEQTGVSEIYLDGKLIQKYGQINPGKDVKCYNPQNEPVVFILQDTGEHVFAIKYVNPNAVYNVKRFGYYNAGFTFITGPTKGMIEAHRVHYQALTFIFIALTGLFLALGLLHFFIYLFNRKEYAHIWYSGFSLAFASAFFLGYLTNLANSVSLIVYAKYAMPIALSVMFLSLSRFIHELFPVQNKYRKWMVVLLAASTMILRIAGSNLVAVTLLILAAVVIIESTVMVIYALIKKHKGARIIGSGILFTCGFIIVIFLGALFSGNNFDLSDSTVSGQIILFFAALAIISIPLSMSVYLAWDFNNINRNLKNQLVEVQRLSAITISQEQEKKLILEGQKEALEKEVTLRTAEVVKQKEEIEKQHTALGVEKQKSDNLLLNILPEEIAEELKNKGHSEARLYENVSVLFTDFVNFTKLSENMTPQQLVAEIDHCFKGFDAIVTEFGIEKIKTIGDAYLAVSGLPVADEKHAIKMVQAALKIRAFMQEYKAERMAQNRPYFDLRFGIHSGSLVAGIVGTKKFAYDIWGDTVNTAARMEQSGVPGKINISTATYELVKNAFDCESRGLVEAKNKGAMEMYFVNTEK